MTLTHFTPLRLCVFAVKLFLLILFSPQVAFAQTSQKAAEPKDIKVLKEYKDRQGNLVRTIQYLQGQTKITETVIIPPAISMVRKPINTDTLNKDSVMLVIDKKEYSLQVYYKKNLVRAYKAVFGPKPLENKYCEGDRCTPEGWYKILSKSPKSKYDKFLLLNYPDDSAMARFTRMKEAGKLSKNARIGGSVGIHGVWKGGDEMVEMGIGWTDGCIALKNKDVEELYSFVNVGTRVYIKK